MDRDTNGQLEAVGSQGADWGDLVGCLSGRLHPIVYLHTRYLPEDWIILGLGHVALAMMVEAGPNP
jgi:hypothetical protein